jgi:glutathionylspermidine synthase
MIRKMIAPRSDWQASVEAQGLYFHTMEEQIYWDESAYYEFTDQEVEILEQSTQELHALCMNAVDVVIQRGWLREATYSAMVYSPN